VIDFKMAMFDRFRTAPANLDTLEVLPLGRARKSELSEIDINVPFLSKAAANFDKPLMERPDDLAVSESDEDEPMFRVSIAHSPVRVSRAGASLCAPFKLTPEIRKQREAVKAKYESQKSVADVDFAARARERSPPYAEAAKSRADRAKYRQAYTEWKRADEFCKFKGIESPPPPPKPTSPPPRVIKSPRVARSNPCYAKFNFNPHSEPQHVRGPPRTPSPPPLDSAQMPPAAVTGKKRKTRKTKQNKEPKKMKRSKSDKSMKNSSSEDSSANESDSEPIHSTTASSTSPSSFVNEVIASTGGKFKIGGKGKIGGQGKIPLETPAQTPDPSVIGDDEIGSQGVIKIKVGPGDEQLRKEVQQARNENKKRKYAIEQMVSQLNYDGGNFADGPCPNYDVEVFVSVPDFPAEITSAPEDSCHPNLSPLTRTIRPDFTPSFTTKAPSPPRGKAKKHIDIEVPFSLKSKFKDISIDGVPKNHSASTVDTISDRKSDAGSNSSKSEGKFDSKSDGSSKMQRCESNSSTLSKNSKDSASSSTELPDNVSSIRLKALAGLSQDQVSLVESLYDNMAITVKDMFDDHLCAAFLDGKPYTRNSHLQGKVINKKGQDESHFLVHQRKLRPTRGDFPGIKTAWDLERATAYTTRAERVRKRCNRFLHASGDAVIQRGPGRWDFRLGHLFPVDLNGILEPVYRLCGRAAAYDGITKKPLMVQTHQIMVVEPGAEIQPWHQDHDGSTGYFTILIALNDSDDEHENALMGGTELCMPTKPPLMVVVPPRKGHGLVFDGRVIHRGLANRSRTTRYFYYVSLSTVPDKNTGFNGQ
jgi:hypothetical protein